MRYKEFITEESVRDKIERDCRPYLAQRGDGNLFKGGVRVEGGFGKATAHLGGRNPSMMPLKLHKILNDYFTKEFGHPFRNGVPAIGDEEHAEMFGHVHTMWPIGNFEFLWSPNVTDLNYDMTSMVTRGGDNEAELFAALPSLQYQTTDLPAAINSGKEIMIWVPEYYMIAE